MSCVARLTCLFLGLCLLGVSAAAQGMYYETAITGGPFGGENGALTKTFLMPRMMKQVDGESQDFMIFRLDQEKIVSVDTREKTYWEQTFTELEEAVKAASGRMEKQMAEMQKYLKDLPEEQRKMMEGMAGTSVEKLGEVRVSNTGEKKSISGFTCTKFEAREGKRVLMTIWATREVKGFDALRKDYESVSRRMTAMNPAFTRGLVDAMLKIEGFPIRTEWGEVVSTVTKIEQKSTPESAFMVPAGYTRVHAPAGELPGDEQEGEEPQRED